MAKITNEKNIFAKKAVRIPEKAEAKGYKGWLGSIFYLCHYARVKILDLIARHFPIPGIRENLYALMGIHVGKGTFIDRDVYFDTIWPELITIGKGCGIVASTIVLTHQRDFSRYHVGDHVHDLPYLVKPVNIGDYVSIGANSIILPGVSIGKGAIVSAGSVVRHTVEPYTLVAGNPARLVKKFRDR